jgi:aminoglycoside 2'-N-acetyltransferase I
MVRVEPEIRIVATAELAEAELVEIRALLDAAFADATDGAFSDDDWHHSLGGEHIVVTDGDLIVAHASVVPRVLLHDGHELRTGYVEGVGARVDRRGRGLGSAALDAVERLIGERYELGALSSAEMATGFYLRRGWLLWQGPTSVRTPAGAIERTPEDDGGVYVLPVTTPVDVTGELTCDWRRGDVW